MRKVFFVVLMVAVLLTTTASSGLQRRFTARLTGDQEATPVETDATGRAAYLFNPSETKMRFRIVVRNIDDVVAAHVHCAPPGVSGPVGITLFSGGPVSFGAAGTLVESSVTAPDAGNGCGWETLADAAAAMRAGQTYDNVHTLEHPGGEIRGNIQ